MLRFVASWELYAPICSVRTGLLDRSTDRPTSRPAGRCVKWKEKAGACRRFVASWEIRAPICSVCTGLLDRSTDRPTSRPVGWSVGRLLLQMEGGGCCTSSPCRFMGTTYVNLLCLHRSVGPVIGRSVSAPNGERKLLHSVASSLHGNYVRQCALCAPVCSTGLQTNRPLDRLVGRSLHQMERESCCFPPLRRFMGTACANPLCAPVC